MSPGVRLESAGGLDDGGNVKEDMVLTKALALSEKGRAEIASKLLASLGTPDDSMGDAELIVEAGRRSEEMERDPSCVVTHEEFVNQFRRRGQ